ncbi:MAG: hypothetical protein RL754_1336 [Bacteroidota bacterium]
MSSILSLKLKKRQIYGTFDLPLSKSMANRALLLSALYSKLGLSCLSESEDSEYLLQALQSHSSGTIFVGDGGTTLRFATAYWACQENKEVILTGSARLNQRPIGPLVEALIELGAKIEYLEQYGFAPIKIKGQKLRGGHLRLKNVESSQFVSALMMIAPSLEGGLRISWESMVSNPYLMMTAAMMREAGFLVNLTTKECYISKQELVVERRLKIEKDWSALAFWCEAVALSDSADLYFPGLHLHSTQGDSKVIHYFEPLGVGHRFDDSGLHLFKKPTLFPGVIRYNLLGEPDLSQALITALMIRSIPFEITGLATLRNKECDRINAIDHLAKVLGIRMETTLDSIRCEKYPKVLNMPDTAFETLNDHRVAMSLAPLSLLMPIVLRNPNVVAKSYPSFWEHWHQLADRNI